jgi:hypothetical protein
MTAAVAFTALAVGAWAGGALVWLRSRDQRKTLIDWETDLRYRQAELARLIDVVADERRQINGRGCGR